MDSPSRSVLVFFVLTKRNQVPLSIRLRCVRENVVIPMVGTNLEEDAFRAVPLVDNRLDNIGLCVKPEPVWPFIRLSARLALDL